MSLILQTGDILSSRADVVVCPVNCVGTMGKGLAATFKKAYPQLDSFYQHSLRGGWLHMGHPHLIDIPFGTQRVCLFPTKWHWREPSRLEWIAVGLVSLMDTLAVDERFHSIAFPALGCGLGGLEWHEVKPLLHQFSASMPQLETHVYLPLDVS